MPTANYGLPLIAGTDGIDVVRDVDALSNAVDAVLAVQLPPLSVTYRASASLIASASSVVFSGIPTTLRLVRVTWSARSDAAVPNTSISCRVNGDSSTLYSGQKVQGSGTSTPASSTFVTQAQADLGSILAGSAAAGRFASGGVEFAAWGGHSKLNGISDYGAFDVSGTNSFKGGVGFMYEGAAPYNSLTFLPGGGNFVTGTWFDLIGWK